MMMGKLLDFHKTHDFGVGPLTAYLFHCDMFQYAFVCTFLTEEELPIFFVAFRKVRKIKLDNDERRYDRYVHTYNTFSLASKGRLYYYRDKAVGFDANRAQLSELYMYHMVKSTLSTQRTS